jgi:glycogen debranching enzyme
VSHVCEPAPAVRQDETVVHIEHVELPALTGAPAAVPALRSLLGAHDAPANAAALPASVDASAASPELRIFEALFGRDSLIVADTLDRWLPRLTRNTVLRLAEVQGLVHDIHREEEPGRIPHEVRDPDDPVARRLTARWGWSWPYYGSVDSTCLWIAALGPVVGRDASVLDRAVVGRDGVLRPLRACVAAAVRWLAGRLDASPSGLLESWPMFAGSIENQVWKDSWDAYSHADGRLGRTGTVASVEAQGLAYRALRTAAGLPVRLADLPPCDLVARSLALRDTVLDRFWVADPAAAGGGFLALATDRDAAGAARPLAVLASNMGHLLLSGLLDGEDAGPVRRAVVRSLFDPKLWCAAGFRSLATRERRFRPTGYHTGNSWPWDSFRIARGLSRVGYPRLARLVARRVVDTCNGLGCFPEFVAVDGDDRPYLARRVIDVRTAAGRVNRIEQPPQLVQAWTVAAVLAAKREQPDPDVAAAEAAEDERALLRELVGG